MKIRLRGPLARPALADEVCLDTHTLAGVADGQTPAQLVRTLKESLANADTTWGKNSRPARM